MKVIKIDLVIYQIITSILILKLMKEYTVYMQWDSYEGSLFNETYTSWYYASSKVMRTHKLEPNLDITKDLL
jgi:hypothetical protein